MSRYSLTRAMERLSRPARIVAVLAAALAACAPLPPAANQTAGQAVSQDSPQAPAPVAVHRADGPLPVPPNLTVLTQPAGQKRLMATAHKQSYWPLSQYFETQRNEAYCSVATSVMVLNALGIRRPASTLYPDFPYFSQEDFFRGIDPQVANAAQVSKEGMTLDQLSAALNAFPVEVKAFHASDLTLGQFRDLIRDTTSHSDRFALLNFRRVEIGEAGGGHWSPLAAYDAASDSALLLDVARYKYPAAWVPVTQLYAAALAVDTVSGISRGIVIVGSRTNQGFSRPAGAADCPATTGGH
ncbi:phytochelatin synthase family protein [Paraburkholderia fungorum]|uniref:glutathione gamma-glutamylcysteinyltransferase n=1 Tax=Paraburkholderia fungorum TaxID=134537 RepID=A0A3R7FBL3_9BURK|nr:phytochelatin synthase family protein [Paraburkholderia fungorum]RKF50210.1 phytochelatin synthase [Paraburkholderia fungorum]